MDKPGFAGKVARRFLNTQITPLLALVGLLMGLFAVVVTPREEEPQINVTFANIFVPFPGASATEVEHLVATPAEQVMSEIEGVKHVYSLSRPGMAILTVQYEVGEGRTQAIVSLYSKVFSNRDWLPPNLGVGQPIIKPKGIDDVPILAATLWSDDESVGAYELGQVAHAIEAELKRVPGTQDIYTIGVPERVIAVLPDPQALSGYGISLVDLRTALQSANRIRDNLDVTADNHEILVQAGTFLTSPGEIGELVVGVHDAKPVFLRDVAQIREGPDQPEQYVWLGTGPGAGTKDLDVGGIRPTVTIAVAKKPGTNAVNIARAVIERFGQLEGTFIPEGVKVAVTRNYGETADAKAKKLISKLAFATASVILLVMLAIGWREALVVGAAVVVTLAITLFASSAWGFTINRVSLFALIFSIGILVDDAIVVVENIHRHLARGAGSLAEAIPRAVDEVGGPTILATFTVIAALLPMAFVSGLMGPYMSPIPVNASMGMLISLAVAFVFTPWATHKALAGIAHTHAAQHHDSRHGERLTRFFTRIMAPFLDSRTGRRNRWLLLGGILALIALSRSLVGFRTVILKMLPFDNKSEFQVVLDMPEGSALEQTARVLNEIGAYLETVPEVTDYQVYAGTASPISFNGLVRQYYLREGAHLGDIQVNLADKHERDRRSHDIALAVVYVTGDMAGETDSPLYGMFEIAARLKNAGEIEQWYLKQPPNPYEYSLKWDGEWQVTYDTFRDMGIAYSIGLVLIYLLVVAQFRSYLVPLVIMAPIPLTIIGILPGHAIVGVQFTATSMIGMIALAGIIVRNSILLVDFVNDEVRKGADLRVAVIRSAAARSKPIVLTGIAAMAGAFFILDDPIFSGLAVSLISGIFVSTILTLVVIPVVYFAAMQNRTGRILHPAA